MAQKQDKAHRSPGAGQVAAQLEPLEIRSQLTVLGSDDGAQAVAAFVEKRARPFTGTSPLLQMRSEHPLGPSDAISSGASAPGELRLMLEVVTPQIEQAPMSGVYEGRQIVGMDLHRRRSVLVRVERGRGGTDTTRISDDPDAVTSSGCPPRVGR